ncbi:MAG: Ig-like domain-containing protein [Acidobacteriota bacterium]
MILLLTAALFNFGCDSADNPIAPSGSTLLISADKTLIGLNGEAAELTITGFRPDGNRLNPNTQLTIATDLGVLRASNNVNGASVSVVTIGNDGRATAFLFGDGRQGPAMVTVSLTSGGGGGDTGGGATSATIGIQIGDDASSQPVVTVTANPAAIALNQSSTITVTARNVDQSPLAGATAIVRSSLGSLSFTNGNVTDSSGVVTLTLTSNQSGQAEVTATVGSSPDAMATVEIGTTRKPVVSINPNPSTLDTFETSVITVTARDESGNLLGSVDAIMTSDLGTLSGSNFNSATDILRLSGGRGEVTYTAGDLPGTGNVTAFVQNSDIASADLTIRGRPAGVSLQASINEIPATGSETITLTATVTDSDSNRLGGESVSFSALDGMMDLGFNFNPDPAITAQNTGVATSMVTVDIDNLLQQNPGLQSFVIQAAVSVGDGTQETDTVVINVGSGGGGS